jgi:hypothetical protein
MILLRPVVKFVAWLKPLWDKAGIDTRQLMAILTAKLIMDGRRELTFNSNRKNTNPMVAQTIMNLVFGLFIAMILISDKIDLQIRFLFFHSALLVFFTIMIISEFSTILFDTRDNMEILPRPVNAKTYYASKIIHIIVYLLFLGIPMSLGGIVLSALKLGIVVSLFQVVFVLFDILIAVFLSNLFYMAIIRFFSARKIKDVVLYLQVFLAIFVYGGYQLLPRLFNSKIITEAHLSDTWWMYLIPSVWPAKFAVFWVEGNFSKLWLPLILDIIVPLLGLLAIVKYFAPLYNQKLSQLDSAAPVQKTKKQKVQNTGRSFVNLLPVSTQEKAYYKLIVKNIFQDRKFKQGIYSLFGYFIILMLLPVFKDLDQPSLIIQNLAESKKYYIFLYFPVLIAFTIQGLIQYSDQYEAAWQYRFLPIDRPGKIIFSGMLVVILRFQIPIIIFGNLIVFLIWPASIWPQVLLSWTLSFLALSVMVLISDKYLPLTRSRNMQNSSQNIVNMFYFLILLGIIFGIAYGGSFLQPWMVLMAIGVMIMVDLALFRVMRLIRWVKIRY